MAREFLVPVLDELEAFGSFYLQVIVIIDVFCVSFCVPVRFAVPANSTGLLRRNRTFSCLTFFPGYVAVTFCKRTNLVDNTLLELAAIDSWSEIGKTNVLEI
ncbi:hypothetical protein RvY_10569 [Ramazzottius varieornatus]|uniref:Uncharacterized protein n=1 Tax=Ramazzottius varieornatus TaxID=947166 RepID=A0A1D1VFM4_RAMVA|nr:hypothetical protein RvY_10569 [Ramazzottius varieornatus]